MQNDSLKKNVEKYSNINKNFNYIFTKKNNKINKAFAINIASFYAKTEYISILDTDVILNKMFIEKSIEVLSENKHQFMIPYNGLFLNLKHHVRDDFVLNDYNYDVLLKYVPSENNKVVNYENTNCIILNTQSIGGMLVTKKENWNAINGLNPNFSGWGFEDDEILYRARNLGYSTCRIPNNDAILFHFNHEPATRAENENLINNEFLFKQILKMSKEETEEYTKTWII